MLSVEENGSLSYLISTKEEIKAADILGSEIEPAETRPIETHLSHQRVASVSSGYPRFLFWHLQNKKLSFNQQFSF